MSKKSRRRTKRKPRARRRGWLVSPAQVDALLDRTEVQIVEEDYEGAVRTARRVLRYVPKGSAPYAEAQERLAAGLTMLQDFEAAYEALSRALEVQPESALLWYNRGLVCRYTMRSGQSVRDLERAVALETTPVLTERPEEALAFSRGLAESEMALRGPGFTLEQLIEQQEAYQQAIELMDAEHWAEARAAFRQVIEMGDCLPQPWGNLGACLIMQERYDEAKAALRRALEVDPDYELARENLEKLPHYRQSGPPSMRIRSPFEGVEIKQSLTFLEE